MISIIYSKKLVSIIHIQNYHQKNILFTSYKIIMKKDWKVSYWILKEKKEESILKLREEIMERVVIYLKVFFYHQEYIITNYLKAISLINPYWLQIREKRIPPIVW